MKGFTPSARKPTYSSARPPSGAPGASSSGTWVYSSRRGGGVVEAAHREGGAGRRAGGAPAPVAAAGEYGPYAPQPKRRAAGSANHSAPSRTSLYSVGGSGSV